MWKATGTFYFEDELFFLLEKIDDSEFVIEVDEIEFQVLDELGLIEWHV